MSASALSFQPPSPLGPFPIKQSPMPHSPVLGEEDTPLELCGELGNLLTLGLGDITHNSTAQQGWVGDLWGRVGTRRRQSPALLGGPVSSVSLGRL